MDPKFKVGDRVKFTRTLNADVVYCTISEVKKRSEMTYMEVLGTDDLFFYVVDPDDDHLITLGESLLGEGIRVKPASPLEEALKVLYDAGEINFAGFAALMAAVDYAASIEDGRKHVLRKAGTDGLSALDDLLRRD